MTAGPSKHSFEIDGRAFRLSAIKKAAYRFGDRCFVTIETVDEKRVLITFQPKRADFAIDVLEGEFRNEVLDQDLREIVAEETEGVRNLLLAQAFSKTSLIDPESETARYEEDPLGIQKPDHP